MYAPIPEATLAAALIVGIVRFQLKIKNVFKWVKTGFHGRKASWTSTDLFSMVLKEYL
jgi:hypothetical protein